ncbi:hypothetical protein OS493_014105 [Desmophyllum pertusum]|uniref:Uncharacterized protein n=1 Tax=Desmophyllum pertusum TaxID=174260 RepID=A0A9W9ZDV1_9CNID|nr:hypothetical protein OS493_014105 [Desmophyllum pertusum]
MGSSVFCKEDCIGFKDQLLRLILYNPSWFIQMIIQETDNDWPFFRNTQEFMHHKRAYQQVRKAGKCTTKMLLPPYSHCVPSAASYTYCPTLWDSACLQNVSKYNISTDVSVKSLGTQNDNNNDHEQASIVNGEPKQT